LNQQIWNLTCLLRQAGLDALKSSVDPVGVQVQLLAEVDSRIVGAAAVHSTPARVVGHLDAALVVDGLCCLNWSHGRPRAGVV
jgi:hypothetical protein